MPINFPSNPTEGQILTTNTKSWVYSSGAWKAYNSISTVANTVVQQTTASGGQTLFTTPTYVQGLNQIRVFINGVRQNNVTDYAETTSSSITLTSGATASDNVVFEVSTYAGSPVVIGNFPAVIDDPSTNDTRYLLFTTGPGGALYTVNTDTTGLKYNPLSETLTTGKLTLQLGPITFADGTTQNTGAGTPTTIATRGINANSAYYPTFVDANNSSNAAESVHTNLQLSFNPSTGTLTANNFTGGGIIPSGTAMLFVQTAAPTGWTKSTTHDNKALRVVSGSASSGGTTGFTSVFTSRTPAGTVSGTNASGAVSASGLTQNQLASHAHTEQLMSSTATMTTTGTRIGGSGTGTTNRTATSPTLSTGAGETHTHGFTQPTWSGSFTGTAMDFAVQYVDVIIATKD
jgi:hypothetical protein